MCDRCTAKTKAEEELVATAFATLDAQDAATAAEKPLTPAQIDHLLTIETSAAAHQVSADAGAVYDAWEAVDVARETEQAARDQLEAVYASITDCTD